MTKHILSLVALACTVVTTNVQAQSIFQTPNLTQPVNFYQPVNSIRPQINPQAQYNCVNGQCSSGQCSSGQCSSGQCSSGQCSSGQCPRASGSYNSQRYPFQNQTNYLGAASPFGFLNQSYSTQTTQSEILPSFPLNGTIPQGTYSATGTTPSNGYNSSSGRQRPHHANPSGTSGIWRGNQPCMHPGCTGHTEADWTAFKAQRQQRNSSQFPYQPASNTFPANYSNQYQAGTSVPYLGTGTNQNLQIQLQQPFQNTPVNGSPFFN